MSRRSHPITGDTHLCGFVGWLSDHRAAKSRAPPPTFNLAQPLEDTHENPTKITRWRRLGAPFSGCWRRRRPPAKPADGYFLIRSRPRLLQCAHNSRHTAPKRLPMVCRKYDDRKAPRTNIHLKTKIPVGRNHRLETAAFGRIDQIAVRQRRPPHLRSRPYIMAWQQVSQRARHILIEQNPHYGVGLCRS